MKVFFVLALVAVWMGGINAASIPEPAARKGEILSDEQIALIIVEVLEQSKAFGILDIVTSLPGLIADLKPIIMKYVSIILDGSLSLQEKLDQIWAHTKDSFVPIIKVVGETAAKEILKQLVIAAAAALG